MVNLKDETLKVLGKMGKSWEDVLWVGCTDFEIPKEDFLVLADEVYDNGFGAPIVCDDLLVVCEDVYFERHEYDGSEWWEAKKLPFRPIEKRKVRTLFAHNIGWESLEKANSEEEEDNG